MNRRGDMLLYWNAEEIKRQATVRLARIIAIATLTGLLVALVINLHLRGIL